MRNTTATLLLVAAFLLALQGCAGHGGGQVADRPVLPVRHVDQQESFSCGAASLEMVAGYWGSSISQAELVATADEEVRKTGFSVGRLKEEAGKRGLKAVSFAGTLDLLEAQLAKGRPVIVALTLPYNRTMRSRTMRKFPPSALAALLIEDYSHFVVVIGMDDEQVTVEDPLTGLDTYGREEFDERWRARGRAALLVTS